MCCKKSLASFRGSSPWGVAVDQATGDVYVDDALSLELLDESLPLGSGLTRSR